MACLFCKIVAGEIPATKVHEDDRLIAFNDINPQAPMHVLVVPKLHVATLNDLSAANDTQLPSRRRRMFDHARLRAVSKLPETGQIFFFVCVRHNGPPFIACRAGLDHAARAS